MVAFRTRTHKGITRLGRLRTVCGTAELQTVSQPSRRRKTPKTQKIGRRNPPPTALHHSSKGSGSARFRPHEKVSTL